MVGDAELAREGQAVDPRPRRLSRDQAQSHLSPHHLPRSDDALVIEAAVAEASGCN